MKKHQLTILLISLIVFCQCSNESAVKEENLSIESFKDSTFLKIEGDLYDPQVIWADVDIYLAAFDRMKRYLKIEKDVLKWDIEKGAEINISENIYDYIVNGWKCQNKQLASKNYQLIVNNSSYAVIKKSNFNISPKSRGAILKSGAHDSNYSILRNIHDNHSYDHLANQIDLEKSNFGGNGMGDASIRGTLSSGNVTREYYCCNACIVSGQIDCRDNFMIGTRDEQRGAIYYEKVINPNQLPLITLKSYSK